MCNLAQAIEDKAIAKGIDIGKQQGIDIGKQQGIKQGKFETTLANIQSLITTLSLTAEKAMDALNIPLEERAQYLPKLQHLN